jgi:hypothetical protein
LNSIAMNPHPSEPPAPTPAKQPLRRGADYGRFGQALALGTNMAAGMAIFTGLGYWLDHRRGDGIGWTLAGMFLGLTYGLYELWKAALAINQATGDGRRTTEDAGRRTEDGERKTEDRVP